MIQVDELRKHYGEVRAVDGVSFEARDGQVTGMLGPNGAGKTTTLRMLSTLVRPDRGRARVDGIDVHQKPQQALGRLGILPDGRGLSPRLTAREHLHYFGQLQGMTKTRWQERTEELATLLDLHELLDRRVAGFSHGERTKVAIARALIHDPRNVILDEATNGLDVMSTRALRGVIRSLADRGHCVLFSSHVMQEVAALCDRIVVFSKGKVVAQGSPDELCAETGESDLENAFVRLIGTDAGLQ